MSSRGKAANNAFLLARILYTSYNGDNHKEHNVKKEFTFLELVNENRRRDAEEQKSKGLRRLGFAGLAVLALGIKAKKG